LNHKFAIWHGCGSSPRSSLPGGIFLCQTAEERFRPSARLQPDDLPLTVYVNPLEERPQRILLLSRPAPGDDAADVRHAEQDVFRVLCARVPHPLQLLSLEIELRLLLAVGLLIQLILKVELQQPLQLGLHLTDLLAHPVTLC